VLYDLMDLGFETFFEEKVTTGIVSEIGIILIVARTVAEFDNQRLDCEAKRDRPCTLC